MSANCCFTKLVCLVVLFRIFFLMHFDQISFLFCFMKKELIRMNLKSAIMTGKGNKVLQKMGINGVRNACF